jgi:hypothetical protein
MTGCLHEFLILLVGSLIFVDVVGIEDYIVRFLILMVVAPHNEFPSGNEYHVFGIGAESRSGDEQQRGEHGAADGVVYCLHGNISLVL